LLTAVIVGTASAFDSSLALIIIVPEKFNLHKGLGTTLLAAGVIGLLSGAKCLFAYLKNHPLPDESDAAVAPKTP